MTNRQHARPRVDNLAQSELLVRSLCPATTVVRHPLSTRENPANPWNGLPGAQAWAGWAVVGEACTINDYCCYTVPLSAEPC